jgi:hypothetical protein
LNSKVREMIDALRRQRGADRRAALISVGVSLAMASIERFHPGEATMKCKQRLRSTKHLAQIEVARGVSPSR